MKNKASTFLKELFAAIVATMKAKSMAVKNKTSAIKTRLILFGLLRNKKVLLSAISHKIHALMGQEKEKDDAQCSENNRKAIVFYDAPDNAAISVPVPEQEEEEDDYPDLRHSLFDSEDMDDEIGDGTGSAVDLVKNSREGGKDFSLEEEIDLVADVFIRKFHRRMKLQIARVIQEVPRNAEQECLEYQ